MDWNQKVLLSKGASSLTINCNGTLLGIVNSLFLSCSSLLVCFFTDTAGLQLGNGVGYLFICSCSVPPNLYQFWNEVRRKIVSGCIFKLLLLQVTLQLHLLLVRLRSCSPCLLSEFH